MEILIDTNVILNYIVTCNVNDFKNAYTKVINPKEFIELLKQNND